MNNNYNNTKDIFSLVKYNDSGIKINPYLFSKYKDDKFIFVYKKNKLKDYQEKKVKYIVVTLISLGFMIMFYPIISNYVNTLIYNKRINDYDYTVAYTSQNYKTKMLNDAYAYNSRLTVDSIKEAFSVENFISDTKYNGILNVTRDGLMGYIEIPKINIKIPIYHEINEQTLHKGVGHLKGSSLPIGGDGTHSILAAHRGLPSSKLFSDLDKLELGDEFYIYVLDEKLIYEVDNISVVKPNELSSLEIKDNEDVITLITCTPYAINTHRLLVRGMRIENQLDETNKNINVKHNNNYIIYVLVSFIFIGTIVVFLIYKRKSKNNFCV